MSWTEIGTAIGGLGLLILGMGLLTDGLKRAAGHVLYRLLGGWTRTGLRGCAAGALITTLVQSSSAVTVAIIGFANAGLLTLSQAAWVVFGSNLGTTMTGWLVATLGLKVKIEALALPLLGVGMLMRLVRPDSRWGGVGEAIAGFGALFVGLTLLRDTFSGFGEILNLASLETWGLLGSLASVGLGAVLTTLMQSSSAAMAVILTARFEGVIPPHFAAALVIGANLGTTSTALLATIGATANARRVALLHVYFNLLTAVAALAMLSPMLAAIAQLHTISGIPATPAADLALFHTLFNVLGILLMWPFCGRLVRRLERRFRSEEENTARPQFLDDNVIAIPEMAVRALLLELRRASTITLSLARDVLTHAVDRGEPFIRRVRPARRLLIAAAEYATQLNEAELSPAVADDVSNLVRAQEHLWTILQISADLNGLRAESLESGEPERAPFAETYVASVASVLTAADVCDADFDLERLSLAREQHDLARHSERKRLAATQLAGEATATATNHALQELAQNRRLVRRAWKLAAALQVTRAAREQASDQAGAATPASAHLK